MAAQPLRTYSRDDSKALLLLLAPFAVMALAVGTTQVLGPINSMRQQLAQFPKPSPVVEASAMPAELANSPPRTIATMAASAAQVQAKPIREPVREVASVITAETKLESLPPRDEIPVRLARTDRIGKCVASASPWEPTQSAPLTTAGSTAFGRKLARAARAQTRDLVVYTDRYRQIGFPMGDVPRFYGVCTDVVIRAYRTLGIDLQVLVHKARVGTGDTSIDHRRTKTLRRFFERYGQSIPVTDFAEEYLPGDIVTYYRASGRTSQTHIAIVSDVIALSGRPMIVHNRGWGPQLEDALFASEITGHYRFHRDSPAEQASARRSTPSSALR